MLCLGRKIIQIFKPSTGVFSCLQHCFCAATLQGVAADPGGRRTKCIPTTDHLTRTTAVSNIHRPMRSDHQTPSTECSHARQGVEMMALKGFPRETIVRGRLGRIPSHPARQSTFRDRLNSSILRLNSCPARPNCPTAMISYAGRLTDNPNSTNRVTHQNSPRFSPSATQPKLPRFHPSRYRRFLPSPSRQCRHRSSRALLPTLA